MAVSPRQLAKSHAKCQQDAEKADFVALTFLD